MIPLVARLRYCIARRSAGLRALLCLLAFGALLAGVPTGMLHAHANGDHGHHHHESADPGDEQRPVPDQDGTASLHHHEATCLAKALTGFNALMLVSPPPLAWHPPAPDARPPLAPRTPPQRPPIA